MPNTLTRVAGRNDGMVVVPIYNPRAAFSNVLYAYGLYTYFKTTFTKAKHTTRSVSIK